jgi:hypothetical protein
MCSQPQHEKICRSTCHPQRNRNEGSMVCTFLGCLLIRVLLRVIGLGPIRGADAWYGPLSGGLALSWAFS